MKLYIISNRLPVKAVAEQDTFVFSRSEGGLTTGLNSLQGNYEKHWVGWPGICTDKEEEKQDICHRLEEMNLHPIFLSDEQYKNYYEGYSNSTLWPLCHYFFAYTLYRKSFWQSYQEVNALFCREIIRLVEPDDWVWVQDYQLMLLPEMLRQELPRLHIGYFHHIPFPSYELFRILPERAEILKGLLGADFIAFHTHDYMRHFISAAERVLHMDFSLDETRIGSRIVRVDALPMGINYDLYHNVSQQKNVWKAIERTRLLFGKHKLILSVDRLDYSKGILHRLYGFASFLEHHPEYHGKVTLAMVIVPSRDHVGSYAELKTRIDEEIGSINGRYSTMNWTPVCYFYHGFSFEELAAMYFIADIALVTPLRDGMNLVAKEYIAVKQDNPGVLVLSEMAGAAVELTDALLVNPNDTEQIENAICRALEMPFEEQKERMHRMQSIVSVQTVNKWAADFVNEWQEVAHKNKTMLLKKIGSQNMQEIQHQYLHAKKRLILLDYDGTLVPFQKRPEDASPTPQLLDTLQKLTADPLNHVVINSGRDHFTLEKWLGALPISFAAEHGAFYKENGGLMPGTLDEIEDMWEMVKSIMTTVMEDWRKPDKGIWEIRGEGQHFVSSKVMCWVALDRGARIARILNKYENSRRWEEEADAIKADVMRNGWKEEIQSFSQAYGNLDLDSSLLLMEPYGFIDADDIRYHKTVKAVKQSLLHKGLMYRYNTHDDFGCPSSAFTICTFWLIRALYVIGEKDEARCLFDEILQYSNHLGLFSEDIDFETKEQLGNFPQAYSHLALVNTAVLFAEEDKRLIFK